MIYDRHMLDRKAAERVTALFEGRGQLDAIDDVDRSTVMACLERARQHHSAAALLAESSLLESAFTAAYDAYRTAADAVVLHLGYRVPATQGGHRIAVDIADAALRGSSQVYASGTSERFRQQRHESEYFDPARPIDKTADDTRWALGLARDALAAVAAGLGPH